MKVGKTDRTGRSERIAGAYKPSPAVEAPAMAPAVPVAAHSNRSMMKDEKDRRERQTGTPAKDSGKDPSKKNPSKDPGKNPRQDRLKLALRENLKRRKSQARGRSGITVAPSNDEVGRHEGSGKKPGE